MNNNRITEVATPAQDSDAATKIYVDLAAPVDITAGQSFVNEWRNRIIRCNNAGAIDIILPNDALIPVGSEATFIRYNVGGVRFVAAVGTNLRQADNLVNLYARWSAATVIKIDGSNWVLFGDLT
jgi:hypothetical protein